MVMAIATTKVPFLFDLVEAAGIEPASANPLPSGSTCLVSLQFDLQGVRLTGYPTGESGWF